MSAPRISALINVRNEEANIRPCLEGVKRAYEIIVVDMESEDRTAEIAREYTDKVFSHPKLGYADPARAFALSKATGDWVLIVDADEIVSPGLWDALERAAAADEAEVFVIPFRTWMFGRELRGGGWGPGQDTHERFFKRDVNILSPRVHAMFQVPAGARVKRIAAPGAFIAHFNYLDLGHFLEKYNRYTGIEAKNAYEGLKPGFVNFRAALWAAMKEFLRRFILRKGWKDGATGFTLAFLMAGYYLAAWHKEDAMRRFHSQDAAGAIAALYEREKAKLLGGAGTGN